MNNFGIKAVTSIGKIWQPQTAFHRFRYWKPEPDPTRIFRYGYNDNHFYSGLLPRGNLGRIHAMKIYRPKDAFNQPRRTFGQNDYIDILGDERMHPLKLADNIPNWLKGFKGTELEMLRLRMNATKHVLPHAKPLKWKKMQTRFEQCFYYFNYRRKVWMPKR
ncbi:large ribosomal subunit protein mL51 [Planococcus citri]|uniref:large ribosomal subunit protein mL51 n=1 Tax=Planococcus citri TaxID=170843 RepID=UPI0031F920F4